MIKKNKGFKAKAKKPNIQKSQETFTHTLASVVSGNAAIGTPAVMVTVYYSALDGFNTLAKFFSRAHPVKFRIKAAYTNYTGLVGYQPINWETAPTTPVAFLPGAMAEARGTVYLQVGSRNFGQTCPYAYAQAGWDATVLSPKIAGYLLFYNDNSLLATTWEYQAEIMIDIKFSKRDFISSDATMSIPGLIPLVSASKEPDDREQQCCHDRVLSKKSISKY